VVRTRLIPIGAAVTLRYTLLAIVAALVVAVAVPRADAVPQAAAPSARAFAPADQVTVAFRFRRTAAGPLRPVAFRVNGRTPAIGSHLGADRRWHTARARLDTAQGWIRLAVDGRPTGARRLAASRPEVGVRIGGLREGSGLVVEDVRIEASGLKLQTAQAADPLRGARLFVDPDSPAGAQAAAWRGARPGDAALLDRIAAQPQADWLGDWSGDVRAAVAGRIAAARAAEAVPVLVAYDIPDRDCGQHSGGGAPDAASYRSWIDRFAAGIGDGRAVVILEPDALAGMDCLDEAGQRERLGLLADAVSRLAVQPGALVYLDAGNPAWRSAPEMARRLAAAGVAEARGFALNVSNFRTTAENRAYGRAISRLIGDKPFVIDTGRNGAGPSADGAWCNPPDRALGEEPTTETGDPIVDAYLWIKRPGESDGECLGGPPAGTWWPEYALGLARRAASPS
jgi:endoglucanase